MPVSQYAGLAAVAAVNFAASWKASRTASNKLKEEILYKYDNSLQQLENDLKDILSNLSHHKYRTVVVLEELDKIDDTSGTQLDSVIRYFKNLFTQAPAIFFFMTDRHYFDLICARIRAARRKRSYAIEHTFFTHRVFVGRPTTKDCIDYLQQVIDGPSDLSYALRSMARPSSASGPQLARFGQFVRVLLFRSSNHLFDLKNEMRRYLRMDGEGKNGESAPTLLIDDESLSDEEAALAKFQALIEEKTRAFARGGGRTYANEVLRDCLNSVFHDLGSTREQSISDFYPKRREENDSGEFSGEEQLDVGEETRIRLAVDSLIEDLHRGGAFEE